MRKFLSLLLSIALVLSIMPMHIWADDAITFSAVKSDDTVTVTLSSKTYENVMTAEAIVVFPKDIVELKSVTAGSFSPLAFESPNITNANNNGQVKLGFTNESSDLATITGTIGTLVFEVKDGVAPGSYTISLTKFDLTADDYTTNLAASDFTATMDATFVVTTEVSTINPTIAAPVKGGSPQTTITEATEYTGAISWNPNHTTFAAETVYTATITLTAKTGYQFTNTTAITVTGANVSVTSVAADGSTITFTATFPATAGKDAQTITFADATVEKTYGDADFTILATHSAGDGAVTYASDNTSVAVVDANTGAVQIKGAGEAVITAKAAETANYAEATASYTLKVAKANQTVSFANTNVSKTYGATAFTETATHSVGDGAVTYASSAEAVATVNASTGEVTIAGAGSAIITATAAETTNYKEATASYTLTVDKADVTYTAPTEKTGLKYNGGAQELVTAGTATGGEMQYRLSSSSVYSSEIPTGTTVGSYDVYYKVVPDANHNGVNETGPITVSIAKGEDPATLTATTATVKIGKTTDLSALVSGAVGTVSYTPSTLAGCSVATNGTFTAGTTTGTCDVEVTVADSDNYNGKSVGTITVTVTEKDEQTLTFANAAVTKTYGEGAFKIEASHTVGDGAVTYVSSDTTVATVNASTGEVTILKAGPTTITATAAETADYAEKTASYTLTVNKAPLTVKAKDHTITYGDAPANNGVEYSGFANGDTESVLSGLDYTYTYAQYNDVGEYSITPADTLTADNYTITRQSGKLTVNPKEAVLSWTGDSFNYDGSAHAPTATVENLAPGDSCDVTVSGGQTDAGEYTATATALSNKNYKLPATATHAFKINKAASSMDTVPAAISGLEYTGSAQALVSAGAATGGEVQYSLTAGGPYSAEIPTATDAGPYNVYYKVVGDANHADIAEAGPITVTIAKGIDPAALTEKAISVKFDGTKDLVALVNGAVGDVSYSITSALDGCSVTTDGTFTTGTTEGTCVVTVAVAESKNYNGKTVGTITIDVKPIVETPVLTPGSQTFSGTLEVTITYTSGAAVYYTLDGSDPTSASTPYTEPISLNATKTIKAIATMAGYLDSEVAEETYTLKSSGGGGGGGGAAAPETNTITPAEAENGKVTASPDSAAAGDTVTLTVTPDEGYQLASIVVKDADGNEIKVTEKDGTYTFTMPDSEVTIEAVFEEATEEPGPSEEGHFIDVHEDDYYYDAVEWAAENGITNGVSEDKFGPALDCTRAQVVTFLWIAYGCQDEGTDTGFDDVDLSDYYDKAVAWAVSEGITAGTSENEFSPDMTVTRCQFVTMLWVSRGMPEAEGTMPFTDVPADAYYAKAVAWAYANDITAGKSATRFAPDDPCTRGQIVTFLYNALAE